MRSLFLSAALLALCAAPGIANPIVHYNFDGNALDSSGLGNHGTIIGSPQFVAGTADQAIRFDNPLGQVIATQYVALPNSASILALQNSSFTFAIQYRSTDAAMTNGRLFGRNPLSPPGSELTFVYNAGNVPEAYASVSDTNNKKMVTLSNVRGNLLAVTTDGQWHWGVVVLDRAAGELRQYVDTTLVASVDFAELGPVLFSDLSIGRINLNPTFGARLTAVDDFQLYDRALSAGEVRALVVPAAAIPEPGSLFLLGAGLMGVLPLWNHRKRNARAAATCSSNTSTPSNDAW